MTTVVSSLCLFDQNVSGKVDSFVKNVMEERPVQGLSLAVLQDSIPVKLKGHGLVNY